MRKRLVKNNLTFKSHVFISFYKLFLKTLRVAFNVGFFCSAYRSSSELAIESVVQLERHVSLNSLIQLSPLVAYARITFKYIILCSPQDTCIKFTTFLVMLVFMKVFLYLHDTSFMLVKLKLRFTICFYNVDNFIILGLALIIIISYSVVSFLNKLLSENLYKLLYYITRYRWCFLYSLLNFNSFTLKHISYLLRFNYGYA